LAAALKKLYATEVTLVKSSGGVFEVLIDGLLVYSKKATGDFPDEAKLLAQLKS